ncbi:hypothetical protein BDN72DRAFT_745561, partial [Pluteus cervinus]
MVSCVLLQRISEALSYAKGITAPFGGVNMIFVGDFAQLPPVAETRLYSRSERLQNTDVSTPGGQRALQGRLLWLSVDVVIELTEYIRQQGSENQRFVDLLRRLHLLLDPTWKHATMIVTSNASKDAINEEHTRRFAAETGQPFNHYYASD